VAVFGQGPVSLAATQLASSFGARVIALDIVASRLERSQAFGAWKTLNPAEVEFGPRRDQRPDGRPGVSKSLETSGASSAAPDALHALDLGASHVG
jgi:threonine dehydrogenase-like Zn-dependent dehydrogenase